MPIIDEVGIQSFPKDNIERVIWWYGPVVKNPYDSDNPLVLLITRHIINNKLSANIEILRVTLPELDQVRLGSIWKGPKITDSMWTDFPNYKVEQKFSFDFTNNPPESISFLTRKPNSNFGYIRQSTYDLGNFDYHPNLNLIKKHFFRTHLTKLISKNGVTVLIPALECLTGVIAPEHKQIRSGLVNYQLDTLLSKFIKKADKKDDDYYVDFIKSKTTANRTVLAYLYLNQISRDRMSSLWYSMQTTTVDRTGTREREKYPQVLPYHPKRLLLEGDGIWIDKTTFLMLRVNGTSLPLEHRIININPNLDHDDAEPDDDDETPGGGNGPSEPQGPNNDEFEVTETNDPDDQGGKVCIRSKVKIIGDLPIIFEITDGDPIHKPTPVPKKPKDSQEENDPGTNEEKDDDSTEPENGEDEKKDPERVSSGEANDCSESKGTKSLEQAELTEDKPNSHLTKIIQSLQALPISQSSDVDNFVFIDNEGNEHPDLVYCRITKEQLPEDYKGRWHTTRKKEKTENEYYLRNFLIVKIHLKKGNSAYILEIARKNQESFLGLIFNTDSGTITKQTIVDLLAEIVQNKGRYTKQPSRNNPDAAKLPTIIFKLPVPHSMSYKHPSDYQLTKIITRAIKKKIFQ
ncbi:MAG: hypothetical protein PHV10_06820 [Sulfuricurvum sp.]|nr:hypothetical protein [Sulfuricurvum sp.]